MDTTFTSDSSSPRGAVMNIDRALVRMGGNRSILHDLANFFLEDNDELLASLNGALAAEDAKLSARNAHSLCGLSANFGADSCASVAKSIEDACVRNDFVQARRLLVGLQNEVARLVDALKREVLNK